MEEAFRAVLPDLIIYTTIALYAGLGLMLTGTILERIVNRRRG
jgi:hypothetical protein